jgi:hypothetical protein
VPAAAVAPRHNRFDCLDRALCSAPVAGCLPPFTLPPHTRSIKLVCLHGHMGAAGTRDGGSMTCDARQQHARTGPFVRGCCAAVGLYRGGARRRVPPPPSRTKWTRRVPHPVLSGHAASSLAEYSFLWWRAACKDVGEEGWRERERGERQG